VSKLVQQWKDSYFAPFPIGKSSPSTADPSQEEGAPGWLSSSPYSVIRTARFWISDRGAPLRRHLEVFLSGHPDGDTFIARLWALATQHFPGSLNEHQVDVGKLGLKDEPAGKVRVFAMVDP